MRAATAGPDIEEDASVAANNLDALLARAKSIREDILRMTTEAGSGHPSSSMSAAEVVTALYFGGFLRHDPKNPHWPDRDRFILSKGHAAPVLYAALAQSGYFPHDEIMTLRKIDSPVEGHPNMRRLPGVEASTGSLGQGLSLGVGHALAARIDKKDYHTYVMTGDGELGEGQIWEAAASAGKFQLDNLTLIVDRNHFQQTGPAEEVLNMDPIDGKFAAFGWQTFAVQGNDMEQVVKTLERARAFKGQPTCILSLTRKGQGILKLLTKLGDENFHGKPIPAKNLDEALAEIG
jgi:transketolase